MWPKCWGYRLSAGETPSRVIVALSRTTTGSRVWSTACPTPMTRSGSTSSWLVNAIDVVPGRCGGQTTHLLVFKRETRVHLPPRRTRIVIRPRHCSVNNKRGRPIREVQAEGHYLLTGNADDCRDNPFIKRFRGEWCSCKCRLQRISRDLVLEKRFRQITDAHRTSLPSFS
jgi:hypothetical protein